MAGAGARALDTLALYGRRAEGDQALQLAGEGTLIALPAASLTTTAARLDPLARRWRQTLFPTLATRFREDAHDDVRLAV